MVHDFHRSRSLLKLLPLSLVLLSSVEARAQVGPGIGNIDCGDSEYFKPFAFVENDFGPMGTNVSVMIRGYFMTIFAPDSGFPPGEIGIYDVSDPTNPVRKHLIEGGDAEIIREAHSLPVALIDGKQYIAIQTTQGIQFWDFTDPLTATRVASISLPGVNGGDYENVAWQTSWQGRYLYVSGGNQGIYVVDTADVTKPQLLEQVPTSATGGFRVGPLFALGNTMVISNMDQGGAYAVLDISNPADPALLSQVNNLPRLYAIAVGANDRIYAAGRDGNFLTHSFTDPTQIEPIKDALIGQDQLYAAVQDDFVFLGRQNNVIKIDITDEQNPSVVGEGTLGRDHPDHGQVTPFGNLIFIGNDHGTGSAFFCHQYGPDTTPLKPQTIYPRDGSTSIPSETRVSIVFSDYVDTETLSETTVSISPAGGEPLEGTFTYAFNTLSFGPSAPLDPNTTYEISIPAGGLSDVMGNAIEEDFVAHFSTGDTVMIPIPDPPAGTGGAFGSGGGSPSGSGGDMGVVFQTGGTGMTPDDPSESDSPSSSSGSGGCSMNPGGTSAGLLFAFGAPALMIWFVRRRRQAPSCRA